jgi:hypothetical protein
MKSQLLWSFGITTTGLNWPRVQKIINSIRSYGGDIESYEIVIIGGSPPRNFCMDNIVHIDFDESRKTNWITRKKNLITQFSSGACIVFMHDYIKLQPGWSNGFTKFGYDWDVCMTPVRDVLGRRFYDWVSWDHPLYPRYAPLNYSDAEGSKHTFIPGSYWIAKRETMISHPLDENLTWGESEDIEWSLRVRSLHYKFNPWSPVKHLKRHRGFKIYKTIYG